MYKSTGMIIPLAQSDPTEADLTSFLKQKHRPLTGYQNVRGLTECVDTVLLILCGGDSIVVAITPPRTGDTERSVHLVAKLLQHPHEFIIHFVDATTATASHLGLAEVGSDHVKHDSPHCENECSATNRSTTSKFPFRFQF